MSKTFKNDDLPDWLPFGATAGEDGQIYYSENLTRSASSTVALTTNSNFQANLNSAQDQQVAAALVGNAKLR